MRNVDIEERRARLAVRHGLAQPSSDVVEAARAMVALHSSDPATVYLSVLARCPSVSTEAVEQVLYDDRTLVRILGMRRTMWVTPTEFAPFINSSSTADLVGAQKRRLAKLIEDSGIAVDGAAWSDSVAKRTIAALDARGEATARELAGDVPELTETIVVHRKDGSVAGTAGVSTRVLFLLSTEAKVVRARPLGSWISSQYRWATTENWLGEPLEEVDTEEAKGRLLQDWLTVFGPGTELDIKWWTGWPVTSVRKTLARIGAVEVDCDGQTAFLNAADIEKVAHAKPWVRLLPSLDPTTMGWKERSWYLGAGSEVLWDRNGNAGPTIWVDGRVTGGWAQRRDGSVVFDVFEDIGREAFAAVEGEANRLERWLGDTRVTPRFRSPHDKAMTG